MFIPFLLQFFLCWFVVWCVQTFLPPPDKTPNNTSSTVNNNYQQHKENNTKELHRNDEGKLLFLCELRETREALQKDLEELINTNNNNIHHDDDDDDNLVIQKEEDNVELISKLSNSDEKEILMECKEEFGLETISNVIQDDHHSSLQNTTTEDEEKLAEFIQAIIHAHDSNRHLRNQYHSIELIGQVCRNYLERKEHDQERNSLTNLQSLIKRRFNQQVMKSDLEKLNLVTGFLHSKQIQYRIAEEIVMLRMIQSVIRGNSQYCDFKNQVNCTVMVQSRWKSAYLRREFDEMKETCQTVQSLTRGRTLRAHFTQFVQNASFIQGIIRKYQTNKLVKDNLAIIEVIQSCMIGRNAVNSFVNSKTCIEAIQAFLIGKLERIRTKELEHEKCKVDCTSTLQATMRGNLVKREKEFQLSAAECIQATIVGALERKLLHQALTEQSFLTDVTLMQSLIRGKIEQDAIEKCWNLVISLQSSLRGYKEIQQFATSLQSTEIIQSLVRGACERRKYSTAVQNIDTLQTFFKAQIIRSELSQYQNSSLLLGAFFEKHSAKRKFREEKQSLTNIQAILKGHLSRENYASSICSVITLQVNLRSALTAREVSKEMDEITTIQAFQRGSICRREASSSLASVYYLGGSIIGKIERSTFLKCLSSVYDIQASIIGSIKRKRLKHIYALVENILALRERKIEEELLQSSIQKITILQSIVRRNNVLTPNVALTIQSNVKGYLIRREKHEATENIKTLSGFLQSSQSRKVHQSKLTQIIQLQAIIRGNLSKKYRDQRKSDLLCLQGLIRGYLWRNESYLYIPNTSLAVAPISVTETIKRIFEDEITEDSSDSSPTEVIPPTSRRVPSFDAVTGGRSKLSQLIKDKVTKSPVLDLSNMNIESLPPIGTDCYHITDLNLSKNMLVTLPEWFCDKFPNLKRLNLSGNRFFDTNKLLSENLSPISQTLTFLDLSKNRLEYFELHYIDENDNVMTTNFPNLTSLNLSYNQLLNVSSEMFELVSLNKLENLDLSHNQLLTFPTLKSSDLLKRWKDFKVINLEHNSFLQSEIGKIFYMFKKRPDLLKQLKGQLYKRGAAKESESKQVMDDLEINAEIGALMEEETQTEMTEMAYHDQFKSNLTSLGSIRTINTNSDYDSEDDELMTDRSFYSSTSNLSSGGISPRFSSPALPRKNRANSASPFLLGQTPKHSNNTESTEGSPRTDLEKDTPELDSPKTPRLELLGQPKPISINVLTPISGQAKYSFIQDIPTVQSTNTPTTFTPPDYETKTVNIPKLNLNSAPSPNTPNNQLTLNADNFLSARSASSDNMSTPNSSLASPVVESENLIFILNTEALKDSFKDFCEKEHSGESIEFYDAVSSFKKLSNPVEVRDLACNIYDLFINPIGKHALNINKKQIDKVKLDLFKEDGTLTEVVSTGTFDSLLYYVKMNLMDPLKRYKATEEFKKLDEFVKMPPVDIPLPRPKWGTARHPLLKVGESKKQFRRKKIPYLSTPKPSTTNSNNSTSEDRTPTIQGSISPIPERKSINIKQMKNRINNLMEILHSERKYLSFLIDLWEMYYMPLVDNKYLKGTEQPVSKKRKSTSEPPSTSEDSTLKRKISFIDKIFNKQKSSSSLKDEDKRLVGKKDALEMFPANLFTIITFNKSFLVSLEERFALYSEEQEGSIIPRMYNMMIGDIFEKSIPYFRIYENYLETYESCMNKIRQVRAQNKEFDTWIKKRKSHPRSRNLEINSLLVVPVQRVVRYKLLIENLIETTEEDHPDHIHLLKALDMIVDVANQQNNNIRLTNNRVKVRMLTQLFDFYEQLGASSISSGGVVEDNLLIREGDVEIQIMKDEKSSPKRSYKVQRAYLFTNVIIFVEKTKQVDKQITQEENTKSSESSQGETNTNMELRKSSSFVMRKLKKSGSENNLTNSPPMHKSIKVEKKHFRLEDAFVSGGSALTIEIRFTTPSIHSLKSYSTNDLTSVGNFNIGSTINSARSAKSSNSTEDMPDSARKRSFSLFGKLTGKHKKQTNISKDQTVAVLSFDSSELKNEWLFDLESSIKEAKQRAANKASKLQISSSFTN
ncbi:rho guanine nucleotide exchange factor [Naegleria gruberi]|uniref:Rho guanine nucleotide exchange factor n=1 Tax=Naegleria gruberi TaxID=5762 RepID=D2V618_NAEGR|nr:rho guanine nucleotide exchange factor [Naegleria gruberi]EFC47749.1 rho guanine nucleotide exchange factor [Naegleria gruberi]|eukprot:XP_002680493.1 rho guanine nucleotide exchange factor [Naegleria gruberi strain NEG-M]